MNAHCPSCQHPLSFSSAAVGKTGRCESCGAILRIGQKGSVSLAEQSARSHTAGGEPVRSVHSAGSSSRSVSRWVDWLIAGAVFLVLGLVIGLVAGRMSSSSSGSNGQEQLGESEVALRQDVASHRKTIEGLQRKIKTEEGQAAQRQASALLSQNELLRAKVNESAVVLRDLESKLSKTEGERDTWEFRATALLENEKVLKSQLALLSKSQTALRELIEGLQAGAQRQAEVRKAEGRLAALARQMREADRQAEAARKRLEQTRKRAPATPQEPVVVDAGGKVYAGGSRGHWVRKNVDSGTYIVLEDGSLWKIDPLDKIDAMLWLPISDITVTKSSRGSPGYDYLLINTDDGEKAHAKYMGKQ